MSLGFLKLGHEGVDLVRIEEDRAKVLGPGTEGLRAFVLVHEDGAVAWINLELEGLA